METGWLCEPESAQFESWLGDAPWLPANGPFAHTYRTAWSGGSQEIQIALRPVKCADFLNQVFYGDTWKNPNEMIGFTSLYNTLDKNNAQNAVNVLDGDGDFDALTSIWVIGWGPRTIFMVTPDGAPPDSMAKPPSW